MHIGDTTLRVSLLFLVIHLETCINIRTLVRISYFTSVKRVKNQDRSVGRSAGEVGKKELRLVCKFFWKYFYFPWSKTVNFWFSSLILSSFKDYWFNEYLHEINSAQNPKIRFGILESDITLFATKNTLVLKIILY